jgi:hypothetical protein
VISFFENLILQESIRVSSCNRLFQLSKKVVLATANEVHVSITQLKSYIASSEECLIRNLISGKTHLNDAVLFYNEVFITQLWILAKKFD